MLLNISSTDLVFVGESGNDGIKKETGMLRGELGSMGIPGHSCRPRTLPQSQAKRLLKGQSSCGMVAEWPSPGSALPSGVTQEVL
jgi:hypothetical protein